MIELIQPTVENIEDGSVDVTVDIRSKSRPVRIHHVVLVLKSHIRVLWHVTTRNLRGTLDIIVGGTYMVLQFIFLFVILVIICISFAIFI